MHHLLPTAIGHDIGTPTSGLTAPRGLVTGLFGAAKRPWSARRLRQAKAS